MDIEENDDNMIELPIVEIKQDIGKRSIDVSKTSKTNNFFDYFTSRFFNSSYQKSYQEHISLSSHNTEVIQEDLLENEEFQLQNLENQFDKSFEPKSQNRIRLTLPYVFHNLPNIRNKSIQIEKESINFSLDGLYVLKSENYTLSNQQSFDVFAQDFEFEEFQIKTVINESEFIILMSGKRFNLKVLNYFTYTNEKYLEYLLDILNGIGSNNFKLNHYFFKTYGLQVKFSKYFYLPIEIPIIFVYIDVYDIPLNELAESLPKSDKKYIFIEILKFLKEFPFRNIALNEKNIILYKEKDIYIVKFKINLQIEAKTTKIETMKYFASFFGYTLKKHKDEELLDEHNINFGKIIENFQYYFNKSNIENPIHFDTDCTENYYKKTNLSEENEKLLELKYIGLLYKNLLKYKLAIDYFQNFYRLSKNNPDLVDNSFLIEYADLLLKLGQFEIIFKLLENLKTRCIELDIAYAISSFEIGDGVKSINILERACQRKNQGSYIVKLAICECLYILGSIHYSGNYQNSNMKLANRAFSQSYFIMKSTFVDLKLSKIKLTYEFLLQSLIEIGTLDFSEILNQNLEDSDSIFNVKIHFTNSRFKNFDTDQIFKDLQLKLKESKSESFVSRCLEVMSFTKFIDKNFKDSLYLLKKSISIRNSMKDFNEIQYCFLNMGIIYLKLLNFKFATLYLNKAVQLQENLIKSNHPKCYIFYVSLANCHSFLEGFELSLSLYDKAISRINNFYNGNILALSVVFHNKSLVHLKMRNFDESLKLCKESIAMKKKINKHLNTNLAISHQLKCAILEKMNRREDLLQSLLEYLDLIDQSNEIFPESLKAELNYRISCSYQSVDNLKDAKKFIKKSFDFHDITNIMRGEIFGKYGEILAKLGNFNDGENMLEQGINLLEKENYDNDENLIALKGKLMSLRFERRKKRKGNDSSDEDEPDSRIQKMITQQNTMRNFISSAKRTSYL